MPAASLAALLLHACARPPERSSTPPKSSRPEKPPGAADARSVPIRELHVTAGNIDPLDASRFVIHAPLVRAELIRSASRIVELRFRYLGPTDRDAPLASGELRRQIGLKLRAQDTCNVVYVMWHIEPTRGIHVSVKANPGQHEHRECGDHGYESVGPDWSDPAIDALLPGGPHTLRAELTQGALRVLVDGRPAWLGHLPARVFAYDGPAGFRTDNGQFEVELLTPPHDEGP